MSKGGELLGWIVGCAAVIVLLGLPTFVLWSGPTVIQQNVQTPTPSQQPTISATASPVPSSPAPTPSPIQFPSPLPTQVPATPMPSASPRKNPPKKPRPPRRQCDYYDEDDNYLYTGPC